MEQTFYRHREQFAEGRNNMFVAYSDAGALPLGYYDGSHLPLWNVAREFVLADQFFMAAFGGPFLNHFWLVCACTPLYPGAPAHRRPEVDRLGHVLKTVGTPESAKQGGPKLRDGTVTPDGFAVNTSQPPYQPSGIAPAPGGDQRFADPSQEPLPPQSMTTIGDTLSAKGVSWAWYSGGWRKALADGMLPGPVQRGNIYSNQQATVKFQPHLHPFNYFARFAPGMPDRARHLKDYDDLVTGIDGGTLPTVAFYKPYGDFSDRYTDLVTAEQHIADLIMRVRQSHLWPKIAIIVAYSGNGGWWDHIAPPRGPGWSDRWGPGTRVPAIIVSPYSKRGWIDSTPYDTTSIIKFITRRFELEPLEGVREKMGDLTNAFDFSQTPGK